MKISKILTILLLALGLIVCFAKVSDAVPMGTAWTYQSRLLDANEPADGPYDLQFKLFDANEGGSQKGPTIDFNDLEVIDGYFTVELDFGSEVFDERAVWLETMVARFDGSDPCTLSPRQKIMPVPHALHTSGIVLSDENTFVGNNAGRSNTYGGSNTFLGYAAGYSNTHGNYNTFSGYQAGFENTTGYFNTFSGYMAGFYNTEGYRNTFSGCMAGYSNTEGNYNTFSGNYAGYSNTEGHQNTFSGYYAGYKNTTGGSNTFLGYAAGYSNTEGSHNTFSGYLAGSKNTTGNSNTFSGNYAGRNNTSGGENSAMGYQALYSNIGGWYNSAMGFQALYSNTEGDENSAMGYEALYSNETGHHNSAVGRFALRNNKGNNNSAIGEAVLVGNLTGNNNSAIGAQAGFSSSGSGHVFLGYQAGYNETGDNKLYIANGPDDANTLIYGDFSTGNVGIGTTNPLSKLSVGGDGSADSAVYGSGSTGVYGSGSTGVKGEGTGQGVYGYCYDDSGTIYGVRAYAGSTGSNLICGVSSLVSRDGSGTYWSGHFCDSGSGGTYEGLYADVRTGGAIDLAEYILDTNADTEAGDVLIADPDNDESVIKSSKPYDATVVGIVSTQPHLLMGMELVMDEETGEIYEDVNAAKLALTGRVPVKVTDENGPIQRGDFLTTSSKTGHAMKWSLLDVEKAEDFEELKSILAENERRRNAIVGKALEILDSGDGKIMALVNLQ